MPIINDMAVNLKSLRAKPNLWDGAILFICICIGLGVAFLHPKSLYEILFSLILFLILILLLIFAIPPLKYTAHNKNTYLSMILPKLFYNHQRRFSWAHIVLVFISTFTVASFFSRLGIDVHHQGFLFKTAVNMLEE